MAGRPLPPDFLLAFDPAVRRPRRGVLIGGAPIRVLKLTGAGADLVDRWQSGRPVGRAAGAGALAARLVDAGLAHPRPGRRAGAPTAAVVIPVRDDPGGLAVTLDSLAATAPGLAVVVVDDGSRRPVTAGPPPGRAGPDGEGAARPLILRRTVPGGPAAARNTGWRAAGAAEVFVFVDAGCTLPAGWPAALLGHFADPGLAAAAPRVRSRPVGGAPAGLVLYEELHSPLDLGPAPAPVRPGGAVGYVPSAVLAVRAAALAEAGGFDEGFRFGEDVDLVWRLAQTGWRVRYDPAVQATHPVRPSWPAWARQRFHYGRSAAPLAARHGRAAAPLAVSPWSAAVWGLAAAGRPAPAAVLAVGSAAALARRAGSDRATAAALFRLACTGHARAAGPLAGALRRAWLPPGLAAAAVAHRWGDRRARSASAAALVAALLSGGLWEWSVRRPATGPLRWAGYRLADDLSYQAGVWSAVVEARSAGALLPRW